MTSVLEIKGLSKRFGRIQAVKNLHLTVSNGQVYGILGPNGSGKTTTLGMILDVVSPTEGSYKWFGGMSTIEARKKIGSILETPCFYPYMTAVQNLKVSVHIKECSEDRIEVVLRQVGLYNRRNDKFQTFSLGMKQRLSIAAALLADPPVLILDEPTNGLDPQGIAEIRELIRHIADQGKTIIMASHLLDEVQKVCTHFCVLRQGVKLHEGSVEEILGETDQVEIAADNLQLLEEQLKDFKGAASITKESSNFVLTLKDGSSATDVNKFCFDHQIVLKKLFTRTNSLEKEFLKILQEND